MEVSISSSLTFSIWEVGLHRMPSSSCLARDSATIWIASAHSSLEWETVKKQRQAWHIFNFSLNRVEWRSSPLIGSVDMESPLDDGGPLQTADDEGVGLGPFRLHQLTFWKPHRVLCRGWPHACREVRLVCSCLTRYREVVERIGQVRVLRFVLVSDEGAVCLQEEVARPPVLDVLPCNARRADVFTDVLLLQDAFWKNGQYVPHC